MLVYDNKEAIYDQTFFGLDDLPGADKFFGTMKLTGAREIILQKINDKKTPVNEKRIKPIVSKTRGRFSGDDVKEIRESNVFDKWSNDNQINGHEFLAFLKAPPYTPKHLLAAHLNKLKDSAMTVKDSEVIMFLENMEKKFKELIS